MTQKGGLSEAGETVVLNTLEDISFYIIDHLSISLLAKLTEQLADGTCQLLGKITIGIDVWGLQGDLRFLLASIKTLSNKIILIGLIFIKADNDVLTERFSETRRKRPLFSDSIPLIDAIK